MLNINMKPFIDRNKKIKPELASDWLIQSTTKNNSIEISSEQLGVKFTVITSSFIEDITRTNLIIEGTKLQGTFLFDGERRIYTEQELFEWEDFQRQATQNNIPKEHLIVGESYIDNKGKKVIFLGTKYIAKSKTSMHILEMRDDINKDITKITKKHLFISKDLVDRKYGQNVKDSYSGKIISVDDVPMNLTPEKVNDLIKEYRERSLVVYFEDFPVSKPKWKLEYSKVILAN